ncbi:MAG: energy-coupling factor transporter ATPase [Clostridia bacterium]|nr:energy-coupling factor transporter ATPase [Clostridia bacterium]
MEAVKFENVRFAYKDGGEESDVFSSETAFALSGVNFSVEEGEFVAVLGHNGSGKSTLARLTNGLLTPSEGKITVMGLNACEEENLFEIRKQVGIVFQNPDNQMVASIVEDDIAFGPENIGIPREEIGERIAFALNAVGMSEFRFSTPSRLSGGQKQRIAIAGVLALKPRIMILDESTAMLDPKGRKEVMDVVVKLNREEKITVILITHFPEEAMLANRAIVMSRGSIVMQGTPQEVLFRAEELEKYSLTLPKSVKICRELTKNGLPVEDGLTADAAAENILRAIQKMDTETVENVKTTWAGTRLMEDCERNTVKQDEEQGRIYCENLTHVYNPSSPFATYALNGVDLEIRSGDFFGIIGHTGSGKSTFVQHLNALLKVPCAEKKYKEKKLKKGELPNKKPVLRVNGYDLTDKTTDFKELRSKVGMVFQYPEYQLFAETVFEDVAFGLKNFGNAFSEEETRFAVKEALKTVGLDYDSIARKSPFELSGGQKRRVAIAGVIVTKPEILVLDEPAAGLDPLGKEEIMRLLHNIHKDWCKTVVVVSHDMDEIAENCTRAAVFSEGKILAVDTPRKLFEQSQRLFNVGLDVPLTAKIVERLKEQGVAIECDYTTADFVEKTLCYAKTIGAGTRSTKKGGAKNA